MGKGKTFAGLGIGMVLSTIVKVFIAKKKNNLPGVTQKNILSFSRILKSLTSHISEQNKKEVT